MRIDPQLQEQVKAAWQRLSPTRKGTLQPLIWNAHTQALAAHARPEVNLPARAPVELSLVHSVLQDDPHELLARLEGEEVVVTVGSDGQIWGTGKYEGFDPGWLYTVVAYEDTTPIPFPTGVPTPIPIPDSTTIGLLGDWGTGQYGSGVAPSQQIAGLVSGTIKPAIAVHLGDVYYAGTEKSLILDPYEHDNFLSLWPGASLASFALNSNHDMYAGGTGYFQQTLASNTFSAQKGLSYFALENSSWIIVGLDTAYHATNFFLNGNLDTTQLQFLKQMAQAAQSANKGLILLTHHNGLSDGGTPEEPLWSQVVSQIPGGTTIYWMWGHVHTGVVYAPYTDPSTNVTVNARCIGHSAIPWGVATELQNNPHVVWFESSLVQGAPAPNYYVVNGFEVVSLNGPQISEIIYDQYGNVRWSHETSIARR